MLIAFIFNIIGMIIFALAGIWEIITWATWSGYVGPYFAGWGTGWLITGVILLVFFVFALFVFMRVRKMYTAANTGDVATLKSLNNMMWAILALIFTGVITGIMLLIAFGPINELGQAPAPPPPPPT
jgi:hypothetical protein